MSKNGINLQDNFLNQIRKEKIQVTLHLVNGSKISGMIKGFDNFIIFLKNETQYLVYKHSISAIVPQKSLRTLETYDGDEKKEGGVRSEPALKTEEAKRKPEAP